MQPNYQYAAQLIRVVDGDTLVVNVDLGFDQWFHNCRIRLLGINAPELNTKEGQAAKAWVIDCFSKLPGPSDELILQSFKPAKSPHPDKYARWDALVFPGRSDVALNDALVAAGHAVKVNWS